MVFNKHLLNIHNCTTKLNVLEDLVNDVLIVQRFIIYSYRYSRSNQKGFEVKTEGRRSTPKGPQVEKKEDYIRERDWAE